jgi:hypothetical protein
MTPPPLLVISREAGHVGSFLLGELLAARGVAVLFEVSVVIPWSELGTLIFMPDVTTRVTSPEFDPSF